ncbi:hypothetical protein GCM10028808_49110 [Spirosoma migulaei]
MNARVYLFLVLACLFGKPVSAQWRLLYHSQDINKQQDTSHTTNQITSIESRGVLSKYLVVQYAQIKRKLIAKKSVWGLVDGQGAIWRSYQKELFLVLRYNGGWVEYVVNRPVRTRLTATYAASMYSRTLDSKITSSWTKAMEEIPPGHISR